MPAPARFPNAALIYNPLAGRLRWRRERELDRAVGLLSAYGMCVARVPTTGPGTATELAREQVRAGADLIIACGGDGTVNEVANGLAGSDVPMAILPAGTGNAAATALGIPWNLWRAAEYIPRGVVHKIALGQVRAPGQQDGRYFFSLAGAGVDGHLTERMNRLGPMDYKFIRFTLEGYRELWLYDFPVFEVHINGEVVPATQVIFGRLCYFALPVTPRADLFTDEFEVLVLSAKSPWRLFFYSFVLFSRRLHWFPDVRYLRARRARVLPPPGRRILVETDAEPAGELPMEFVIVPEALSLLVPRGSAE